MHQWNANTYAFTSPYRFNSKELDPETGLAYYGARYYQNKLGVWLSVDRYASKYPNSSPFSFSGNNSVVLIDPNGDSITTTLEAWGALLEGIHGVFNTDEKESPFKRSNSGRILINESFDLDELKTEEQKELYRHYKELVEATDYEVNVRMVDNFEPIKTSDKSTTLREQGSTGVEVSKLGQSDIYISRNPEYKNEGKYYKDPQALNAIGITGIHELGGHAYYSFKGYSNELNNKMTTDFDNRIRQIYKARYNVNHFKKRPSIPHNSY